MVVQDGVAGDDLNTNEKLALKDKDEMELCEVKEVLTNKLTTDNSNHLEVNVDCLILLKLKVKFQ